MLARYLSLVLLMICSFPAHAKVYEDYDQFTGSLHQETDIKGFMGGNILDGTLFLSISPVKTTHLNKTESYRIRMKWSGRPINLTREARRIVLLIDDVETELVDKAEATEISLTKSIDTDGRVPEVVSFRTTAALIETIAGASKVECALYLDRGRISGTFSRRNLDVFREFVEKVLKAQ